MIMDDFIKSIGVIYEILDFFPDGDPLKNRAKNKALDVSEGLAILFCESEWTSAGNYFSEKKKFVADKLLNDIDVLMVCLEIGKRQKWLNGINFLIASKECGKTRKRVAAEKAKYSFFGNLKSEKIEKISVSPFVSLGSEEKLLGSAEKRETSFELSERQKKILEIIRKREKTQVSDIAEELPKVTKRTIRRDIDELLKNGKISKSGEWNKTFYQNIGENSLFLR